MDELAPRGELRATNPEAPTQINVAIPQCGPLGTDSVGQLVQLLRDFTAALYGAVAAARTIKTKDGKVNHSLETIISSGAIAATQAEAMVILCSAKCHRVAEIHLRALGEIARRVIVIYREPAFAKAVYESLQQSRRALVEKVPEGHPIRDFVLKFFPQTQAATMRGLERKSDELFKKHEEGGTLLLYESEAWSKWQHGDIVALADAADAVRESGTRLQEALHCSKNDHVELLHRACGFAITLLYVFSWLGVEGVDLDGYLKRFASFSAEIKAKTDALKKIVADHQGKETK